FLCFLQPQVCCATTTEESDLVINSRDNIPPEVISDHPNLNLLPQGNCGEILDYRVSNGNKTNLFEFPWMALLRYETDGTVESLCGGSLISELYVLTAAHCVAKLKSTIKLIAVRLGEYDTTTDIDCQLIGTEQMCAPPVQDIPIEEKFAHPMYDKPRFSNDVAILRLARPANMTPESVRPICLPTTFEVQNTTLKRVSVTGWGTTETQRPATVLLQALLPIVPNDVCISKYYKRSLNLTSSQMCAGGELGIDSCKGDSGGPLIYPATLDAVRMVQFGIISAGVSVCSNSNEFPGIYVKVAYYMRWILDQMRP
ncbi:Serine protease grass, partial [Pseudolycoriella hygida]